MKGFHLTSGCCLMLVTLLSLQSQLTLAAYSMSETCAYFPEGYIADPDDCQGYGYCSNGALVGTAKCGKGFLYDSSTGACNYADKVKCTTKLSSTCTNIDSPVYVAEPDDCTKACYCDGNGKYTCVKCPQDMYFNPIQRACVWSKDYACPANSICRLVPNNKFVGDPEICGNYYLCFSGSGDSTSCDLGKWFNPVTGYCVNENICQGKPEAPTPGIGPGVEIDLPENESKCSPYGQQTAGGTPYFVSDGETCMGYYVCENAKGPGTWIKCPMGTHFSQAKQECVTPYTVKCTADRCANINQQYVSALGCTSYLYCDNQTEMPNYGSNCADLNSSFKYFDEFLGACVNKKPDYEICKP